MQKYISDNGKILPRRFTGTCAKHQRHVAEEVKKARFMNSAFDFVATFLLVPGFLGYGLPKLTEKDIKSKYKNAKQSQNVVNNNTQKTQDKTTDKVAQTQQVKPSMEWKMVKTNSNDVKGAYREFLEAC